MNLQRNLKALRGISGVVDFNTENRLIMIKARNIILDNLGI